MLRTFRPLKLLSVAALSALLILGPSAGVASPSVDPEIAKILEYASAEIQKRMKSEKLHGVSMAIVDQDGNRWVESFGFASRMERRLLTNDTSVPLHELAKLFTAVSVMQLVEQGRVDLDAAYRDYVPGFVPHGGRERMEQMTVRHLMSHHSGLPSRYSPGYTLERDMNPVSCRSVGILSIEMCCKKVKKSHSPTILVRSMTIQRWDIRCSAY